jgi:hypothetical protein
MNCFLDPTVIRRSYIRSPSTPNNQAQGGLTPIGCAPGSARLDGSGAVAWNTVVYEVHVTDSGVPPPLPMSGECHVHVRCTVLFFDATHRLARRRVWRAESCAR